MTEQPRCEKCGIAFDERNYPFLGRMLCSRGEECAERILASRDRLAEALRACLPFVRAHAANIKAQCREPLKSAEAAIEQADEALRDVSP